MCGIAGIAGPHDDALLERLGGSLRHRGPDGGGLYRDADGKVGLVARRLAILDIPGGAQPMHGESATIVFNGEIYNAPELRRRLELDGVAFDSGHSDTEVVLRGYERCGPAILERLNGMFAFVVHDRRRGVLFGARDRLGIKPLLYARAGGGLAFASELRTLLLVPGVQRRLDRESLFHYLSLRFVPGPRSIFEGIRRLPPGHCFTYDLGRRDLRVERWWRLSFSPEQASRAEWVEHVREALREAVVRWTLADVPVACSLSGGLDSSAVVALLAEAGQPDLRTYTLGFTSPEDASLDELPLARALAERYGTRHHELVAEADDLLDDLLAMVWSLDEPYGGGLPSWYVFRFMAEDVKVGLTGTGGDELFGNYRRFVPFETGRLARLRRGDVRRYHFEPSYYFRDAEKRELLATDATDTAALLQSVFDESGSRSARDSVLHLDLSTQLPDEFLHMTDRFSMAFSLEARTPYLDHELVELVARIPPELRTSAEEPKGLLRDAVADLLTPAHLEAPKRGFVFPLARWLRGELRPLAERLLSDEHLARQGIFRPGLEARLLRPHLEGDRDESERLWPLLMFQLWHLLYVEEALEAAPTFGWRELIARV
ncbi:MAG: asparagine synthase (glutamine-hydrolyzing) [Gaiellaceae bacterium]